MTGVGEGGVTNYSVIHNGMTGVGEGGVTN